MQKGSIQGITLASTVILARLLDASAFGLVALTGSFIAFAQMFIDQGFGVAIVQRKSIEPEHLDSVFWMNLVVSLLLYTLGFLAAPQLSRVFNEPAFIRIFRVLLLVLPVSAVNLVQRSLLQKNMAFRALAMPHMIGISVGAFVGVFMALAGAGVWSLVFQSLTVHVTASPLLWYSSNWRPRFRFSLTHFRQIFSFSVFVLFSQLIYILNSQIDRLFIGYFLGSTALGIYAIAARLAQNLYQPLTQVISMVFYPLLSRRQSDRILFHDCLYKSLRLTSLVAFPLFTGLSLVSHQVLPLVYGIKWSEGIPVMQTLPFLFLAYVLFRILNTSITASGNPRIILKLHIITSICLIVLVYFGAQIGIFYVALAYLLVMYCMFPFYLLAMRKHTGYRLRAFTHAIFPATFSSLLMSGILLYIRRAMPGLFSAIGFFPLVNSILIGMLSYITGVWIFAPRWTRMQLTRFFHNFRSHFRHQECA